MMRATFYIGWITVVCLLALLLSACAGARCRITASSIQEPVSFTSYLYDDQGELKKIGEEDIVRHFEFQKRNWSMLWRLVDLSDRNWDISDRLKSEIEMDGGEAIVNLRVTASSDWMGIFTAWVPVIPNYILIRVEGNVVRTRNN